MKDKGKERRSISIRKSFRQIQAVTILLVVLAVVVSHVVMLWNMVDSVRQERGRLVEAQAYDARMMLDQARWSLDHLTEDVVGLSGLWAEDASGHYFAIHDVYDELISSYSGNEGEYFFVIAANGTLIQNNANLAAAKKFALNDYFRTNMAEIGRPIKDARWKLYDIDGAEYLVLCYEYNHVYAGVACSAETALQSLTAVFEELSGDYVVSDTDGTLYTYSARMQSGNVQTGRELSIQPVEIVDGLRLEGGTAFYFAGTVLRSAILTTIILSAAAIITMLLANRFLNRLIVRPIDRLSGEIDRIQADPGHMKVTENARAAEIIKLQHTLNVLLGEVIATRFQLMNQKMEEQEVQLRSMRSQLRSHFYLNAIMMVSNMTYQNRNEDIREYLDLLSRHMRYMLRINTEMLPLGEELDHVNNYVKMQNIRFPDSVVLIQDCPEALRSKEVPHLMIYTIVENAFKYAMNLTDTLLLMITCEDYTEAGFQGYRVIVEDNGKGFSAEFLKEFGAVKKPALDEEGQDRQYSEQTEHIGLDNIRRTLSLRYHRDDLLRLSDNEPHGARVELLIPGEMTQQKAAKEHKDEK